jgi:hypothetical protein
LMTGKFSHQKNWSKLQSFFQVLLRKTSCYLRYIPVILRYLDMKLTKKTEPIYVEYVFPLVLLNTWAYTSK